MKRYFLLLCAGAILFPAWVHAQDAGKKESAKKIVVPFELIKTQHMVINVKINGKGPYRLIFDTGAPDSLVSNKIMKEAGLAAKGGGLPIFGSRGNATIKDLEIGDLKAQNVSTMVMDHPTVQAISNFVGPLEGIIGFTFYSRYKMTIDYEKSVMTFEPSTYEPGNVMELMVKRLSAPKSEREAPRILAPAGLLGIRVEKAVDAAAGVLVKEVMADTAAAAAGIKAGDRLLTLDGRWTDTIADTYIAAGQLFQPGATVIANLLRDGKKLSLKVAVRAGL